MNTTAAVHHDGICDQAAYERDGFLLTRSLFSPRECQEMKTEALAMMRQHAGAEATVLVGVSVLSERFRRLASDPRIIDLIAPLMPDGVMFMSDKFVYKSAAKSFPTPWHVDRAYWPGTRAKLSVWLALDEARQDNGCMKVCRGGHLRDWQHGQGGIAETNNEFHNVIPDPGWASADEVAAPVPQGGAVIFGDRLPHASFPNDSGRERYALILTYHAPGADEPFDLAFPARHVIRAAPIQS